jgi:hypothetical protein
MAHPLKHAESSARKFGGKAEDYGIALFDTMPKESSCARQTSIFGVAITNSEGKQVPVH